VYADLDKLKALTGERELIQLTDRADVPTGEIDAALVADALQAASALIDGYVGAQYRLPLPEVPPMLADLACDLARHRLYPTTPPEFVQKRHDQAMKTLRDVADGRVKLPIADGAAAEPPGRDQVMVIQSEPRRFSRSSMEGW
jgi:phage gp36-like protein